MTDLEIITKTKALLYDRRRWTQNAQARTAQGSPTNLHQAFSFSLAGALFKIDSGDRSLVPVFEKLRALGGVYPSDFNDRSTHAEVLALLDRAIEAEKVAQ